MNKKDIGDKIKVSEICFGTSALGNMPDTYGYEVNKTITDETILKNKIVIIRDIQLHPNNGKIYFLGEDALWLMEKI